MTGVARLVQRTPATVADLDDAFGVDVGDDDALFADHPLAADRRRGEPGPDHVRHPDDERQRDAADAGEQRDPGRPQRRAGQALEEEQARDDRARDADTGPESAVSRPGRRPRTPASTAGSARPPTCASGGPPRPVQARITQTAPTTAATPTPAVKNSNTISARPVEQQQVGDRWAGDRVEQLVDQRRAWRSGPSTWCRGGPGRCR